MAETEHTATPDEAPVGGFGTIDEKRRVSLPKAARVALGIQPGSSVAYNVLDAALLLVPQDEQLAQAPNDAFLSMWRLY